MNKEQALKLVERIDALTPTTEDLDIGIPSKYLSWNWGGDNATIEKVKKDGYFCIPWPEDMIADDIVIKKNGFYYCVDSYPDDDTLFGSKIHESMDNRPLDEDVTFMLD